MGAPGRDRPAKVHPRESCRGTNVLPLPIAVTCPRSRGSSSLYLRTPRTRLLIKPPVFTCLPLRPLTPSLPFFPRSQTQEEEWVRRVLPHHIKLSACEFSSVVGVCADERMAFYKAASAVQAMPRANGNSDAQPATVTAEPAAAQQGSASPDATSGSGNAGAMPVGTTVGLEAAAGSGETGAE